MFVLVTFITPAGREVYINPENVSSVEDWGGGTTNCPPCSRIHMGGDIKLVKGDKMFVRRKLTHGYRKGMQWELKWLEEQAR